MAVGVEPSQGLLLQVGASWPDHDPARASSREMLIGPGGLLAGRTGQPRPL